MIAICPNNPNLFAIHHMKLNMKCTKEFPQQTKGGNGCYGSSPNTVKDATDMFTKPQNYSTQA